VKSIIQGFEYDIFISYRHNDNRSGWVTDFVEALKEELAATIKEPLGIYFDKNPEDGLLETHHVGKSLEGKLKCLIFIPILSQTYCDPKGFAWNHEFCVFNKLSAEDQFGRDVKLSSGNVANRILPVRIHDLDAEDYMVIEKEIGGVLRAIEFIYKEPGVNRPLKPGDTKNDNQHKTDYRNQVNKVANAVKEMITAMKSPKNISADRPEIQTVHVRPARAKRVIIAALFIAVVVAGYFVYSQIKRTGLSESEKSVAVLAFVDMSPGKDQEWFSDGLSEEILNSLAHLRELKVTARTSSFYYKDKDIPLQEIARKLGVAHIVEGSVRKNGQQLRITAQLIRAEDGFHVWSDTYDRNAEDVFRVQTEIAENIARTLLNELSPETQSKLAALKSSNVEAYEYYLRGYRAHFQKYYITMLQEDFQEAEHDFLKSISLDPEYAEAYGALADLYDTRSLIPESREKYRQKRDSLIHIGLKIDPNSAQSNCVNGWSFLKRLTPNLDSAYFYFRKAYELYPNTDFVIAGISGFYGTIGINEVEIKYVDHALELDPLHVILLNQRGLAKMNLGLYDEAKQQFEKALEVDHSDVLAHFCIGMMSASKGDLNQLTTRIKAMQAIESTVPLQVTKTLQALQVALKGKRSEALSLAPTDMRVLSILKMKAGFLNKLDTLTSKPIIRFDPAGLKRDPQYDFVRNDPRFISIVDKVQKKFDKMKAAYPAPD
jgi:adenylate cyclase